MVISGRGDNKILWPSAGDNTTPTFLFLLQLGLIIKRFYLFAAEVEDKWQSIYLHLFSDDGVDYFLEHHAKYINYHNDDLLSYLWMQRTLGPITSIPTAKLSSSPLRPSHHRLH